MQETWVWSLGWGDLLEKGKATHSVFWMENSKDCIVHGVTKGWTRLSEWTELNWRCHKLSNFVTSVFITFTVFCFKKPLLQMGLLTALQLRFNPFAEGAKNTSRFWADWLRQVTKLSGFFLCWLKFLFFRTYCSLEALCLAAKNKWTKYPPNFVCG